MKIVVVNKFYYPRGGDCVCSINLESLLKEKGHEVAFFSMQYPENLYSDSQSYFPVEVSFSGGIAGKLQAMSRLFAPKDVAACFNRLLDDFQPDVIHLNNVHSYLSPIVGKIAKERGIKVVWTLHDYKLICPSYACLANGQICQDCFTNKQAVLKNRCMKGSLLASSLAYMEAIYWNKKALQKQTDCFICPSEFMYLKMNEAGFNKDKLLVLNNFVDASVYPTTSVDRGDYMCYVGRLSEEKGVETLLAAVSKTKYKIKVLGAGPLFEPLKEKYASFENITFLGHQSSEVVRDTLAKARFSILCSECYENNPMSIIESLCIGTPVLGAQIGGIPELINESNGMTFKSKDADSLAKAIEAMFGKEFDYHKIQQQAFGRFDKEIYYSRLMDIYK